MRKLLDTVRPGGLLLAVYHDLTDEHREHLKSQGADPADYVDADDRGRLLGGQFTIELHAVQPRIDPPPDTPHIADVVLRAASLKHGPDECSPMACAAERVALLRSLVPGGGVELLAWHEVIAVEDDRLKHPVPGALPGLRLILAPCTLVLR